MSDQQEIGVLLAEQLERLFTRQVDPALMVSVERGEPAQALWQEIEAQGALLALADPQAGGAGLDWVTCRAALATTGRHAAPVPLGETMVAAWALAAAGIEPPAGPLVVFNSLLSVDANGQLAGAEAWLPWAHAGGSAVALAERDGQRWLALLTFGPDDLVPLDSVARVPGARVMLHGTPAQRLAMAPSCLGPLGLLPALGVLRSVQIAAALERVLTMTIEYANTRQQFGQPIGRFQAVQHLLADLAAQAAVAQAAALYGCRQLDADAAAGAPGAAVAKIVTSRAAGIGAAAAHQVFGAIGVTDEHPLHHFTRRLWQWRSEGGSEHFWAEQLGAPLIAAGGAALWPAMAH